MRLLPLVLLLCACDPFAGSWSGTGLQDYDSKTSTFTVHLDLARGAVEGTSLGATGYRANLTGSYDEAGAAILVFASAVDGSGAVQCVGNVSVSGADLAGSFTFASAGRDGSIALTARRD